MSGRQQVNQKGGVMTNSLSSSKMLDGARSISRRELIKAAGVVGAGGALWEYLEAALNRM